MKLNLRNAIAVLGRVLIAFTFISGGIGKMISYGQAAEFMTSHHVNAIMLPAVIALELFGGLAELCANVVYLDSSSGAPAVL